MEVQMERRLFYEKKDEMKLTNEKKQTDESEKITIIE